MDISEEGAVTFTWRIENFSHCQEGPNEHIVSPEFFVKSLYNSRLYIDFYPNDVDGYSNIYLVNASSEQTEITINYQLSIINVDGTVLNEEVVKNQTFCFQILNKVCDRKRFTHLSQDTLILIYRVWNANGNMGENIHYFARTLIGVEKLSKLWSIPDFSKLRIGDKLSTALLLPENDFCSTTLNVSLVGISTFTAYLKIQITGKTCDRQSVLTCTISFLNRFGNTVKAIQDKQNFSPNQELAWTFAQCISRKELLKRRSDFLFQDVLSLKCELNLSFGEIVYQKIENTHFGYSGQITELMDTMKNSPGHHQGDLRRLTTLQETRSCLAEDLSSLYETAVLSDLQLEAGDTTYRVHKTILCARSPVFHALLMNNNQKGKDKSLTVPNVDADTMSRFLLYVYTDAFENVELERVSKLYYFARKYQVQALKQICFSALKSKLTVQNVSVVLEIGDKQKDEELTSATYDFILNHDKEIMQSEEWLRFLELKSQLAAKTMYQVYRKKLQINQN